MPVTAAADARRLLGFSAYQARAAITRGDVVRLRRGVVVGACHMERAAADERYGHLLSVRAMLIDYPDAVAGYASAALGLGLPVLVTPEMPLMIRAEGAWRGGAEARVRIAPLPAHHVVRRDGIACTSTARTVVDVARVGDLREAAVVGDAALRRGSSRHELYRVLDECAAWSDIGKARRAVEFLDGLAESPFESLSRATMHMYDVPLPALQVPVQGASGVWYRSDFLWKAKRLIGEADGRAKYFNDGRRTPEQVLFAEKQREDDLREAGYDFIRWTYSQMMGQPELTVARILRKLSSC